MFGLYTSVNDKNKSLFVLKQVTKSGKNGLAYWEIIHTGDNSYLREVNKYQILEKKLKNVEIPADFELFLFPIQQ